MTFYPLRNPELIAHTNTNDNSTSLLVKLGYRRREAGTTNRPIIFVVHSLGGLVVANGLSSQSGSDEPRQEVVNSTSGIIFLGTPFKGSDKASWAILAEKFVSLFGDSNDQTIKDVDKKSAKPQQISDMFPQDEIDSWKKKDLGQIVTKQSATIAGYQPMPINADHRAMCRFAGAQTTG
ncbi:hypothetical protein CC80DRAFT_544954 [Byssothecium circinans]|uniref:DUF676 domain-containing protein n=1 Tax=Byssothecium circinans TaxID=147558 RepID=A0A6A5UEH4_9PLEO|nr:hypothetical protein CC80DRAFT_544954 [Byssothecium circinans]